MRVDVKVSVNTSQSGRVRQLEGMFDCPTPSTQTKSWSFDAPIDEKPWNVGLIVGPSGAGKSTIARQLFGDAVDRPLTWQRDAVIDDFDESISMLDISDACRAVGFNTIPAWMRPFHVLSTGEKFRVELARRIIEHADPVVVDEFTSVVDRQVAKIASSAVAKFTRKRDRKFVAISCHSDIIDWLQPDWIIEPHVETFSRRLLQRRPSLDVVIRRVHHSEWKRFAPFHYLTTELNVTARCFVGYINDEPAVFCGVLYRPHPKVGNIYGLSRLVTLPDFQGIGAAPAITDALAACYKTLGGRFRTYPAHPSLIHSFDKSNRWSLEQRPGRFSRFSDSTRSVQVGMSGKTSRPCAVFEFRGDAHPSTQEAIDLVGEL